MSNQMEKKIRPLSTIVEEKGGITLRLEMPGVKNEDIEIMMEGNELRVYGKRTIPEEKGEYLLRERALGDFFQSYTIDNTINRDKINACMENGILTLTLEIKESEKPRKIPIKT